MLFMVIYFLVLGLVLGLATFMRYNDLSCRRLTFLETLMLSISFGLAASDIGAAILIYIYLT